MLRIVLLCVFTLGSGLLAAQDSTRFITGKHWHVGAGVSDYIGAAESFYRAAYTTGFGFDWSKRFGKHYSIDAGWTYVSYNYTNADPVLVFGNPYGTPSIFRRRNRKAGADIHLMNWYQPVAHVPVKIGAGGAVDFLFANLRTDVRRGEVLPRNTHFNATSIVQPSLLVGIGLDPKSFRRITPELIGRYSIYTSRNFNGWPGIDPDTENHHISVMLRLNININLEKQTLRRHLLKVDSLIIPHKWSFYLEVFGAGQLVSLNAEYVAWKNDRARTQFLLRSGVQFDDYLRPGVVIMPILQFGKRRLQGELGAGVSVFVDQLWIPFNAGMRIALGEKWFMRINYTPAFRYVYEYGYRPFNYSGFGMSVGYHWRRKKQGQ